MSLLLGSGIVYAFLESTLEGKIVLFTLFIGSIFSWSVMITKIRVLNFAKSQSERFMALFRRDREPLNIYKAGCEELCFQVLGSTEVDETFKARLKYAERITPAQMRSVQAAMERAVGESSLRLESQMIILSTAVSGAPFVGLLGTVWGVMDAFGGIAASGSASLAAMAPGVSGALITTVTGLLVAIPAMFGYNFLVTSVRGMIEHRYVSHGSRGS
jgi:biopolymer transport protein TolQ